MKKRILLIVAISFFGIASFAQSPSWLWAKSAGGINNDFAAWVVADASGNIYICGGFVSPTITFGTTTLTSEGGSNIFLVKYNSDGNVLWAKSTGGTNDDYVSSVAADGFGNIYLAGEFKSPAITFGSITLTNETGSDIFIVKYNSNGNVLWAKDVSLPTNGENFPQALTLDPSGNIYLAGNFNTTITFGTTTLTSEGGDDFFLVKYNSDGNVLWAKSEGGTNEDYVFSVAADGFGNIYLAGEFTSSTLTFGTTTLINKGNEDAFLTKYNSDGNVLWAKSAGGVNGEGISSVAPDASGNIYALLYSESHIISFGSITLSNEPGWNYIVKYNIDGNVIWAKCIDNTWDDDMIYATVDPSGNTYVSGDFYSPTISFGTTTLTNKGGDDIVLAKFNSNGSVTWAKSIGGTNDEGAYSVALGISGNIYLAGAFGSPTLTFGSTTIVNNGETATFDMFIAKLSNATGINEINSSSKIEIYPNPASNTLSINAPQHSAIGILNIQGKLIISMAANSNSTTIDISSLPTGVYFVKAVTGKGVVTKKFIKE